MKDQNKQLIIFAVLGLLLIIFLNANSGTFILYGGVDINATTLNKTGECWTLGPSDGCVRQVVNLIHFNKQNLDVCPEGYYITKFECEKNFRLTKEKINCYYIKDNLCWAEPLELDSCPSNYYSDQESCEASINTVTKHVYSLFSNPQTTILVVLGVLALLILIVNSLNK